MAIRWRRFYLRPHWTQLRVGHVLALHVLHDLRADTGRPEAEASAPTRRSGGCDVSEQTAFERIRKRHQPEIVQHRNWSRPTNLCQVCGQQWPCEIVRLVAVAEAAAAWAQCVPGSVVAGMGRNDTIKALAALTESPAP